MAVLANTKHEAVLQAYLADPERVGWRAYRKVYAKSSQRAAETAWSRLLKSAVFAARLKDLTDSVTQQAVTGAAMDLAEVLLELSHLGRVNMQDYFDADGSFVGVHNLTREQAAAVAGLEFETRLEVDAGAADERQEAQPHGGSLRRAKAKPIQVTGIKFKLHDKRGALAELRRHLEPVKHQHTGKDDGPIEVKDVDKLSELEVARRIAFALEKGARSQAKAPAAKPAPKAKPKRKASGGK